MTPKEYKQMEEERKNLVAEGEMAYENALCDRGHALRQNELHWAKFYEKWYGTKPKTQKTLDSFKRKTHKVTKTKRKVK